MRLLDRLLRRTPAPAPPLPPAAPQQAAAPQRPQPAQRPAPSTPAQPSTPAPPIPPAPGFAVLDLETTGFSPARERVVEVAVVRVDTRGEVVQEWATLLDPERATVGATQVHGITADDVRGAPTFAQVAGQLRDLLTGQVLVAHNAAFDLHFLAAEFARAGVVLPDVPHLCTLEASRRHLPDLRRRRLADCCAAAGVALGGAHEALHDARAAAGLLQCYLRAAADQRDAGLLELAASAARHPWPVVPAVPGPRAPLAARRPRPAGPHPTDGHPGDPARATRLLEDLPLDAADVPLPEAAGYLELLAQAMADGVLTSAEVDALADLAATARLTPAQVHAAHRSVVLALAEAAWADGTVTDAERAELLAQAGALGLDPADVTAVLAQVQPLQVGDQVAFTGGIPLQRHLLERRTVTAGLVVASTVSDRTAVLVTDDVTSGTAKARAALAQGTRVVTPEHYTDLLDHVQPAPAPDADPAPGVEPDPAAEPPAVVDLREPAPAVVDVRPAAVRAWARREGLPVSDRGRIPRHLVEAYLAAGAAQGGG